MLARKFPQRCVSYVPALAEESCEEEPRWRWRSAQILDPLDRQWPGCERLVFSVSKGILPNGNVKRISGCAVTVDVGATLKDGAGWRFDGGGYGASDESVNGR